MFPVLTQGITRLLLAVSTTHGVAGPCLTVAGGKLVVASANGHKSHFLRYLWFQDAVRRFPVCQQRGPEYLANTIAAEEAHGALKLTVVHVYTLNPSMNLEHGCDE